MTVLEVGGISSSSVSRITKEFDEKFEEFLSKRIEREIPYLLIDATYFKVIILSSLFKTRLPV